MPATSPDLSHLSHVSHLSQQKRFVLRLQGQECELCYRLVDGAMAITHTEVPAALEGRGLASILTRAAVDHARAQGLRVRPLCSYARAWMRRRPDSHDLLDP